MLECYLQRITEKRHQHVGLYPLFQLMEQRPDGQLALECAKGSFYFRQLHVLLPEICSTIRCQIRAQQIGSLARFEPLLSLRLLPPDQAWPFFAILHRHLIEICYLRMGAWMRPRFRSILKRSLSLPSAIRFSSPASAFSIFATKRFRMAFSFSFRPAVRHRM